MSKRAGTPRWVTPAEFHDLAVKHPTAALGLALRKEYLPEIKADDGDGRVIQFRITTGAVDRDKDTINPGGWDCANYLKNPVVLFAHDYSSLPVAKSLSVTITPDGVSSLAEFVAADVYPFAETVYRMVKAGFLNATSVGFRPNIWAYNEERGGVDFSAQELLEYSIVPVPANPEAIVEARSVGIDTEPLKAWAEQLLDSWHQESGLWLPKSQVEAVVKILTGNPSSVAVPQANQAAAGHPPSDAPDGADGHGQATEDKDIPAESEPVGRPYPNEHACRLQDPDKFDRFRRGTREHEGKAYSIIFGHPKDGGGWEEQAYRYPKDSWSASEARSHCRSHDGASFEPASGEAMVCAVCGGDVTEKRGRVLSGKNEGELRSALAEHDSGCNRIRKVLAQLDETPEQDAVELPESPTGVPHAPDHVHPSQPAKEERQEIELPDPPTKVVIALEPGEIRQALLEAIEKEIVNAIKRLRGRVD